MPDKKPHVDGSVERIEKQIQIGVLAQFAAPNSAAKRSVSILASRPHEALAKGRHYVCITLTRGQNGGYYASLPAAKDLDDSSHLLAHVRADRAGVRKVKFPYRTAGECVGDERGLVGPPAVNCCLAHAGVTCHVFNRQIGKAVFAQKFQRAAQDRRARLFTARPPRRTLASAVVAILSNRRLLAHGTTLPYNRIRVFRIRYAEYRI